MIIAVTGASGFLGKKLILRILQKTKHNVLAITSNFEAWEHIKNRHRIKVINRYDFNKIKEEKIDVLINCAFPRNEDGMEMAKGLNYIKDIFEIVADSKIKAVINISSQSVYSSKRGLAAIETDSLNLETKYAVGKYASELMTNIICSKINHTNIRLASLIGPEFNQRVVNKMIRKALDVNRIEALDGNMQYGFMDVDDAADGILAIVDKINIEFKEIYNLGSEKSYTLLQIANEIASTLQKYNQKIVVESKESDQVYNSALNSMLFFNEFGFKAQISLCESIEKIYMKIKSER